MELLFSDFFHFSSFFPYVLLAFNSC